MSIEQVMTYTVRCNVCGKSPGDLDIDDYAWRSPGDALQGWRDDDLGATFHDSRGRGGGAACWECIPYEPCSEMDGQDGHTWLSDSDECAEHCGRRLGDLLAPRTAVGAS